MSRRWSVNNDFNKILQKILKDLHGQNRTTNETSENLNYWFE